MSGVEDIIKRILALKPNLTKEAVERLIDEERAKAAGLLTGEAAAHLVASNLGLDGAGEKIEAKLKIGDLTTGLSDVSLTGRVIHLFPAHTFERRDGREGKVLRMILGDSTGSVAVVFWDEKADQVVATKVSTGKIVRVLHGYTRERRGEIEINVGNRGQLYLEPMDAVEEDSGQPVAGLLYTLLGLGMVVVLGQSIRRTALGYYQKHALLPNGCQTGHPHRP